MELTHILNMFLSVLFLIAGSFWIGAAVDNFNKKHYFRFGLNVMLVIYNTVLLIKSI